MVMVFVYCKQQIYSGSIILVNPMANSAKSARFAKMCSGVLVMTCVRQWHEHLSCMHAVIILWVGTSEKVAYILGTSTQKLQRASVVVYTPFLLYTLYGLTLNAKASLDFTIIRSSARINAEYLSITKSTIYGQLLIIWLLKTNKGFPKSDKCL
jgi:hypothetical protein